ncbi:MAG: FAD-binding oxidoreductase [Chloroflexi bacterium]|nr:FAD-binding oxidoreductase [Chloroflexota bacterium]
MLLDNIVGTELDPQAVRDLEAHLLGQVIRPGDAEYEAARSVWNGSIDRHPSLIVKAADAADVIRAVSFARRHQLTLAVRSGGHSFAGYGTCDGLVLDLSGMCAVSVDPVERTLWAQPGANTAHISERAQQYGLALPTGDTKTVGLGGLTLGGGMGFLVRKYGLTIDNLLSVELVTADGRLIRASADEHPDLFWALRGGGGNFGVVTAFQYRLQPVGELVFGGGLILPASEDVLRNYVRAAEAAPDELSTISFLIQAPPLPFIPADRVGSLVLMVLACYVGDQADGERAVAPLRALAEPVADLLGPLPFPGLYQFTEVGERLGAQHHDRAMYVRHFDQDAASTVMDFMSNTTSPMAMTQIRVLGGAMARVSAEETAFGHRDKPVLMALINLWDDPADSIRQRAWTERYYAALWPHGDGVYVNFLGDEGTARVHDAYPTPTYHRLSEIKARYDPTNFFRLNQNIKPRPDR